MATQLREDSYWSWSFVAYSKHDVEPEGDDIDIETS